MNFGPIVFVLFVYLLISWIIAQEFAEIALKKGYSDNKYFWYCLFFGIVGYLMIIALPLKQTEENSEYDKTEGISDEKTSSGIKKCPACGVHHDADFDVCPSCKHEYNKL